MSAPFRHGPADAAGKSRDRADLIRAAMRALASDPDATGATLILPDGEVMTINADDARAMYGAAVGKPN